MLSERSTPRVLFAANPVGPLRTVPQNLVAEKQHCYEIHQAPVGQVVGLHLVVAVEELHQRLLEAVVVDELHQRLLEAVVVDELHRRLLEAVVVVMLEAVVVDELHRRLLAAVVVDELHRRLLEAVVVVMLEAVVVVDELHRRLLAAVQGYRKAIDRQDKFVCCGLVHSGYSCTFGQGRKQ